MGQMTRDEIINAPADKGVKKDVATIYADAYLEYHGARANILEHGTIVSDPRTAAAIQNPYLVIRDRAAKRIAELRRVPADFLWQRNRPPPPQPTEVITMAKSQRTPATPKGDQGGFGPLRHRWSGRCAFPPIRGGRPSSSRATYLWRDGIATDAPVGLSPATDTDAVDPGRNRSVDLASPSTLEDIPPHHRRAQATSLYRRSGRTGPSVSAKSWAPTSPDSVMVTT